MSMQIGLFVLIFIKALIRKLILGDQPSRRAKYTVDIMTYAAEGISGQKLEVEFGQYPATGSQ